MCAVLLIEEENKRNNLSLLGTVETDAWPMNDFTPFLTNDPDGAPPYLIVCLAMMMMMKMIAEPPVPRKTHKNASGRHPFPPADCRAPLPQSKRKRRRKKKENDLPKRKIFNRKKFYKIIPKSPYVKINYDEYGNYYINGVYHLTNLPKIDSDLM